LINAKDKLDELNEAIKEYNMMIHHEYSNFQLELVPLKHFHDIFETYDSISEVYKTINRIQEFLSKEFNKEVKIITASNYTMCGSES